MVLLFDFLLDDDASDPFGVGFAENDLETD